MKATIVSTDQIVEIDAPGAPPPGLSHESGRPFPSKRVMARVWEGETESGVKFTAYIPVVQVARTDDNSQFERELSEHKRPEDWTRRAIDMRLIL